MTDATPSGAMTPFHDRMSRLGIRWMTVMGVATYRLSGGRVGGNVPGGAPVCLLTTTGQRTRRPRCVPLLYLDLGDELAVVASRGGLGSHPAWYLNLLADPDVVVERGRRRTPMRARTADPDEKARLWPQLVAVYGRFADYQARTERDIPVVLLRPRAG